MVKADEASIRKAVAQPSARAFYQLRQMLSGGLTLAENMNAAIIEVECKHGVETRIPKTTLTGLPIAFTPLFTDGLPVVGTPLINYQRTDGYLGLTVVYAASSTTREVVEGFLPASPNPPLLSTGVTTNLSSMICSPGQWDISCIAEVGFATGVTSSDFVSAISTVSATLPANTDLPKTFAKSALQPTSSSDASVTVPPVEFNFSSTTTVYHVVKFTFTAGSPRAFGYMRGVKTGPPPGYSATVTGILWGG